uniref:Uncharacterized protein n=1 Tax=Chrysotila carterae TaxID=13221 RepID=A0A7S4BI13_CHRCT
MSCGFCSSVQSACACVVRVQLHALKHDVFLASCRAWYGSTTHSRVASTCSWLTKHGCLRECKRGRQLLLLRIKQICQLLAQKSGVCKGAGASHQAVACKRDGVVEASGALTDRSRGDHWPRHELVLFVSVAETAALAQSERVEAAERADDEAVAVAYHTQSARASDASYGTSCGRAIRCGK